MIRKYLLLLILNIMIQSCFGSFVISLPWVVSDIKYSKLRGKMYAVVDALDPEYGNHIIEINPATGEVERSRYVGSEPALMRLTTDENYAWITLDNIPFIRRVNLETFVVDKDIYLGPTRQYWSPQHGLSTILAYNFTVLPDDNNALVLGLQQPFIFSFDALAKYQNDTILSDALKQIPNSHYPMSFEPVMQGEFLLGHYQSNFDNVFLRMKMLENGLEYVDKNDSTAPAVFMRNFFKVHHDTVYNAEGYVLDASDSCALKVLGQCKNDVIGDRYGFTFSEAHNAFIYPNLNGKSLYLTYYDRQTFQPIDSVFLFEYPFSQLMMVLELEVIDKQCFAVLIGKDYGEFTVRIINTDPNATGDVPAAGAINVFPNPATGIVSIEGLPLHKEISLYDITGRLLDTFHSHGIKTAVNLQPYPRGLILLKITDSEQKEISFITKILLH
ncbi:MAG: T9SS type A sorting domain-containing protein [Bacteroidales bacterium]